jgi:hypothetical protein
MLNKSVAVDGIRTVRGDSSRKLAPVPVCPNLILNFFVNDSLLYPRMSELYHIQKEGSIM